MCTSFLFGGILEKLLHYRYFYYSKDAFCRMLFGVSARDKNPCFRVEAGAFMLFVVAKIFPYFA